MTLVKWKAAWIWCGKSPNPNSNDMVRFRKTFELPEGVDCELSLKVSADSRYQLYINGHAVGVGPCKGDVHDTYYEEYEVSSLLKPGKNVIAATVLHYASIPSGTSGPVSIYRTSRGGLFVQGSVMAANEELVSLNTDETWCCLPDPSYQIVNRSWRTSVWMGGVEEIDGRIQPAGCAKIEYDDKAWETATVIERLGNVHGVLSAWNLAPRPIPMLFQRDCYFERLLQGSLNLNEEPQFIEMLQGNGSYTVPAGSKLTVELDAEQLTTAYLRIGIENGKNSRISITPSESYEFQVGEWESEKRIRDDYQNGKLIGDPDVYTAAGWGVPGSLETYEPFWFRTFRFVKLEIETGDEALVLHQFNYRQTGYPLLERSRFESSKPEWDILRQVSIRTLANCMHETYEDCPYYEQLQYTMDTMLMTLFTYYLSGDDRMARRSLEDYRKSAMPDGMLQSRYPSLDRQIIPGFSLYWISMLFEHYMHFGDRELLTRNRLAVEGVLEWFENRREPDGLVGKLPEIYWNYIDWVKEWENGIPPAGREGSMTVLNLLLATALGQAAFLMEELKNTEVAHIYTERKNLILQAVNEQCRMSNNGLFRDGPHSDETSQHAQIWAVLAGAVSKEEGAELLSAMEQEEIPKVSFAMSFFLFRAYAITGLTERTFDMWGPWEGMLREGLTTWKEDPVGHRSDCHGWGSLPLYAFPAYVLGVKPDLPGYAQIRIEPCFGSLEWASGTVPCSVGEVAVAWRKEGDLIHLEWSSPEGIPVRIILPNGVDTLYESGGAQSLIYTLGS
ncbi:MAG: alpha-L-rhamnosidase N-terminal domain-containing protein [Gorillibacterium sp.]|nr:alpha-L-rhamnosidase N-terminal domain-containing protein [Gorillibacterium sp.]